MRKMNFEIKTSQIKPGFSKPLGVCFFKNGVNFSLRSQNATDVSLCFFTPGKDTPEFEITLDRDQNKTDDIWHILIEDLPKGLEYAYRLDGPFLKEAGHLFQRSKIVSDPLAKELSHPKEWGKRNETLIKGRIAYPKVFDWENICKPKIDLADLIIYEMHIRGFTIDSSSKAIHPGSFLGVIEKIPYLKELGVNAVELLPIFEFDECSNPRINPKTNTKLYNYWGYSPINFFSPMNRYKSKEDADVIEEFKTMVRELHRHKIEVILDVVYNHTAEGNSLDYYLNYRGIDNRSYYLLNEKGEYLNFSGCGNTFNANHPLGRQLILLSLSYWAEEMQVDGFRFDLASILTRGEKAEVLDPPPLIEEITTTVKDVKLFAEPWDCGGLYQIGKFSQWGRFSEWNGRYRDSVRRYFKGEGQGKNDFIKAITGSKDLYKDKPTCSLNFITCHDGFSLRDLVSYEKKRNFENGENNSDGLDQNDSWNCNFEGESSDVEIENLRQRQMRNFIFTLFTSQGVPMLQMTDEYGHTRFGNNNSWCHDNSVNWFLWNKKKDEGNFFNFTKKMIQIRKDEELLRKKKFFKDSEITIYNTEAFITLKLKDSLYLVFNSTNQCYRHTLPDLDKTDVWQLLIDTFDFQEALPKQLQQLTIKSYSCYLLKAFPRRKIP